MEFPLGELPPELQARVLSARPGLVLQSSGTSRAVRELMSREYLTELCAQPISLQEKIDFLRQDLDNLPPLLSIFVDEGVDEDNLRFLRGEIYSLADVHDVNNMTVVPVYQLIRFIRIKFRPQNANASYLSAMRAIGVETTELMNISVHNSHLSSEARFQINSTGTLTINELITLAPNVDFGLGIEHRIVSRRMGCIARDPDYPTKIILTELDNMMKYCRKTPSVVILFNTFLRFYVEAYMYNLTTIMPMTQFFYSIEGQSVYQDPESDIRITIESLYIKLRRVIAAL